MSVKEFVVFEENFNTEFIDKFRSPHEASILSIDFPRKDVRVSLIVPPTNMHFRFFGVDSYCQLIRMARDGGGRSALGDKDVRRVIKNSGFLGDIEYRDFSASSSSQAIWEFTKCGFSVSPYFSEMAAEYGAACFCDGRVYDIPKENMEAVNLLIASSAGHDDASRSSAILLLRDFGVGRVAKACVGVEDLVRTVFDLRTTSSPRASAVDIDVLGVIGQLNWPHFEVGLQMACDRILSRLQRNDYPAIDDASDEGGNRRVARDVYEKAISTLENIRISYPILMRVPENFS